MKLAIVGSRSFTDYDLLKMEVDKLEGITEIISGGAMGADNLGARYAIQNDIVLREFLPDWDLFGKAAGFERNKKIVNACDMLIAFWDEASRGTANSIGLARDAGKKVIVVKF